MWRCSNTFNTFNMDVRGLQPPKHDSMMLFGLHLTLEFPKLGPHLHRCNSVRVHPKSIHSIWRCSNTSYTSYSYIVVRSKVGWITASKHDTMMLLMLTLTPIFSNFGPHLVHRCNSVRVPPFAHPQHMNQLSKTCFWSSTEESTICCLRWLCYTLRYGIENDFKSTILNKCRI